MNNFDQWNDLKKVLHQDNSLQQEEVYFNIREVRFAHVGINIKHETDGKGGDFKRPVLILKRIGNLYLVLPMTTRAVVSTRNEQFYYNLSMDYFGKTSRVMLSQVKTIDKARFIEKMGMIGRRDFKAIKKKLKALISL